MKLFIAGAGLAASIVVGAMQFRRVTSAPVAVASPSETAVVAESAASSPCASGPLAQEPWFIEWQALQRATLARGGLEMGAAGFHPTPKDSMHQIAVWDLSFHRYADGSLCESLPGCALTMPVLLNQEEAVRRGVVAVTTVPNPGGGVDVVVTFSDTILDYVQRRQEMFDADDPTMLYSGVALVHDNCTYSCHGYGEIATAIKHHGGQVHVAVGVAPATASVIAAALQ